MLALLLVVAGCGSPPAPVAAPEPVQQLTGEAFGTTFSVKWRGAEPTPDELEEPIASVLERIDQRMSSWNPDSELSEVRDRPTEPVVVSDETLEVVRAALALAADTDGAFDPTVEPLMALWGFRGERREAPPSDAEIEAARAKVGYTKVIAGRDAQGRATIDAGGTALDLSAIAKGHAVDAVSLELSRFGAADHLVEIGGEVRAHGEGPGGPWRLGVDRPEEGVAPGTDFAATLALTNASLATSGNYRNAYEVDGSRVVHTMDPRTGRPYDSVVASVSVVAPDCRTADGWATALMVLDPEAGRALVDARPEIDALWLVSTEDGFEQRRSARMADWVSE